MSKTKGQRCQHTHQSLEAGKTRETKERTQQECSEAYEGTDKEAKAKRDSHQCWEITEGRQQETNPYTATNSKANSASLASGMCSKTCHVEGGKVLGGKNLYKTVSERHFNFCSAFCCFWYPILLWICLWNAGVLSHGLKAYIPLDRSYPWHPNNGWWVGLGICWSHHAAASAEIPPKRRELATLSWYPIDAYMSMYTHEIISSQ